MNTEPADIEAYASEWIKCYRAASNEYRTDTLRNTKPDELREIIRQLCADQAAAESQPVGPFFEVWDGRTYGNITIKGWEPTWQVRALPPSGEGEKWTVAFYDTKETAEWMYADLERHALAIFAAGRRVQQRPELTNAKTPDKEASK